MAAIVISYRRADTGWITGRVFDRLEAHFGRDSVFMDIDNIPLGRDFREHIKGTLDRCDVLLAIIGPHWIAGSDRDRLSDESDWVRIEIETALAKKVPVIPVLIDQAQMPKAADLPDSLRDLAFHQAAKVDTGIDFTQHMERLIRSLDDYLSGAGARPPMRGDDSDARVRPKPAEPKRAPVKPTPIPDVPPPAPPKAVPWKAFGIAGGAVLVLVLALAVVGSLRSPDSGSSSSSSPSSTGAVTTPSTAPAAAAARDTPVGSSAPSPVASAVPPAAGPPPAANPGPLPTASAGPTPSLAPVFAPAAAATPADALALLSSDVRRAVTAADASAGRARDKAAQARAKQVLARESSGQARAAAAEARDAARKADQNTTGYRVVTGQGSSGQWRYAGQVIGSNKRQGVGVITYGNGNRYEGNWVDDSLEGHGIYSFADGTTYEGELKNGDFTGVGVYVVPSGKRYEGEFVSDKFDGVGVYIFPDNERYEGELSSGKYSGSGVYFIGSGNSEEQRQGDWSGDEANGFIVVTRGGIRRWAGAWKNDKKDGYGAAFDTAGRVTEQGLYASGDLKQPVR